jgi:hypothetical protein
MKQYIGTKLINAIAMTRLEYNILRGWVVPPDEDGADGGYLVEYKDGGKPNHPDFQGYISWSPKEQFEKAYRPTDGLNFGLALEALKAGHKVARAGWNGKNQFVYLVPANSYPAQTEAAKKVWGEGGMVPYNAYFALKGVNNVVSTWVPSSTDCMADDWAIVP